LTIRLGLRTQTGAAAFSVAIGPRPWFLNVTASDAIRHALASFMQYGTFEKFPKLKIVILEVGAGWVQYWLDRMDAVYDSVMGRGVPLTTGVFTETVDGSITGGTGRLAGYTGSFTSAQNGTALTTPESPVFGTFGGGTFTNNGTYTK